MRRADALVSQSWAARLAPGKPRYEPEEPLRYPVRIPSDRSTAFWGDAQLEWNCRLAGAAEKPESYFWAGVYSTSSGPLGQERNEAWIRDLEDRGLEFGQAGRSRWLGRPLEIREVAALGSTVQQTRHLAEFVLSTFATLTSSTPA
jgi:hypothetical protein